MKAKQRVINTKKSPHGVKRYYKVLPCGTVNKRMSRLVVKDINL